MQADFRDAGLSRMRVWEVGSGMVAEVKGSEGL